MNCLEHLPRNARLLLLSCLFLHLHTACEAQAITDSSLKLHFNFEGDFSDGKVVDASGNGHDGWRFCPTNWISGTNGVFCSRGAAWRTNSVIDYLQTTNVISQYIGVTNLAGIDYLTNGTISLWVQFGQGSELGTALLDAGYSASYAFYKDLATNSWSLRRDYRPYLSFLVFDSTSDKRSIADWPTDVVQPNGFAIDLSTTRYHLYTLTFSCTQDQAIAYYDGQPVMTNSIGLPWLRIYCATPWLSIGALSNDGTPQWGDDPYPHSGFFDGNLDDLRIYNRALSGAEVQGLYVGNCFAHSVSIQQATVQSVRLTWGSMTGATYQVESATNLDSGGWQPLGLAMTNSLLTNALEDSISGQSSKFYRVRVFP
jgi:hypothetical protein